MKALRPAGDVAALPTVTFGHRSLMWWGTVGFMVIEGSMFVMAYHEACFPGCCHGVLHAVLGGPIVACRIPKFCIEASREDSGFPALAVSEQARGCCRSPDSSQKVLGPIVLRQ